MGIDSWTKLKEAAAGRTKGEWVAHSQDPDLSKNWFIAPHVPCYEQEIMIDGIDGDDAKFIAAASNAWSAIEKFIDAALAVDNLNMSMAREDMERRIAEYNEAKRSLLG